MSTRKKLWSMTITLGDLRVRIYEPRPGGNLMRSIWIDGRENRKGLGYKDRGRAKREMQKLLAHLQLDEHALRTGAVTLSMVQRMYLASADHAAKKPRTQQEDARKLERVVSFLGAARKVKSLSRSDVNRFVTARRRGDDTLERVQAGRAVSDGTIRADLVAMQTMINWAANYRDEEGRPLIAGNPLRGVPLPVERNPKRPVLHDETVEQLLAVAGAVDPLLRALIVVAEGTGRRLTSIRLLRWSDIDFGADDYGRITWRKETDKQGRQMSAPITQAVREALLELQRRTQRIGETWVFPSPTDDKRPCSRHLLDDWLRRAFARAGLVPERGGMWHPFRRRWATLRKHYPIKDLAYAGGWRDATTLQESYLIEDEETIREIVLTPTNPLRRRTNDLADSQQTHNAAE